LNLSGKALLVAQLKADPSYPTEESRAAAFVKQGGGCRATYFNHARKLPPPANAPSILLRRAVADEARRSAA
jgi:hypothetical protein